MKKEVLEISAHPLYEWKREGNRDERMKASPAEQPYKYKRKSGFQKWSGIVLKKTGELFDPSTLTRNAFYW